MITGLRLVFFILMMAVIGSATYAFASSDAMVVPARGEGAGGISGWVISNVHYQLSENAVEISGLEFDLDRPARMVRVKAVSGEKDFYACNHQGNNHWFCAIQATPISKMDELRIVASD